MTSSSAIRSDLLAVGVLGPLVVLVDGRPMEVSSPKLRMLLVLLAMEAGSPISLDRLAAALWNDDLPEFVRRATHTYLTRLRAILGAESIVTEPGGYRLRVEPEFVDALKFTQLLDAVAEANDATIERANLVAALELWRGDPFNDISSAWLDGLRTRLVESYLAAVERRVDLDLAEGRHRELVAELRDLTVRYPLREPLWIRLLTALHRCGRRAEALSSYESVRLRLADELGVDPTPELQRIHAELLADRSAKPASGPGQASISGAGVPRQLPADIDGFTGRDLAIKALDGLLGEVAGLAEGAVVISVIGGMAGIGKTALAVHWAHKVADLFPDGQLYVNLRGFDSSGQAMAPAEAIRGFLEASGVPASRIPTDPEAQAALYRSVLSGRRMLVVLDNARDPDQVRPLLPGTSTCLVLVTSRSRLTGLVAIGAARPLVLDLLSADEARDMLAARLGRDRVAAEPMAIDAIVARCAGLPLAIAVAAASAATSRLRLSALAVRLDEEQSALDMLETGDPTADVRVVFSWSHRSLTVAATRLFQLLSLHPGPDIGIAAVASLAGATPAAVQRVLAELCGAHMLTEHRPRRYVMHDLLRSYATELGESNDDDTERRASLHRLFDHYLHTANAAGLLITPRRHLVTIDPPQPGVTPEPLADDEQALAWLTAEHEVTLAVVDHAAATDFDAHAWQLAWALSQYLYRRGCWDDWRAACLTALAAARRGGDKRGEAVTRRGLAMANSNLGRHADAEPHLHQALALFNELKDHTGQAHTHLNLAALLARQRRYTDALHNCHQALALYTSVADPHGEAMTFNTMGVLHAELGDYNRALDNCHHATTLFQHVRDASGLASAWDSLGYVHHRSGSHQDAIRYYRRAARLFEELGYRHFHAETLDNLGDAYLAAGDIDGTRTAWHQSRDMFEESGHPQADRIQAKLDAIGRSVDVRRGGHHPGS